MKRLQRLCRNMFGRYKTAKAFALVALVFGSFLAYSIPPLWGSDEPAHIARVYQLAEGNLRAEHLGDTRAQGGYGGHVPEGIYAMTVNVIRDLMDDATTDSPIGTRDVDSRALYKQLEAQPIKQSATAVVVFPNTAAYSPVAYVPQVVAMKVAVARDMSLGNTILLVRLAGLLAFVVVIYAVLRALDKSRLKWVFFVAALMPMSLFEASIITADSITTAVLMLFVALIIKAVTRPADETLGTFETALLVGSTIALPLLKPGYVAFLPLLLFVPAVRAFAGRMGIALKVVTLAIAGVGFALWSKLAAGPAADESLIQPGNNWQHINSAAQTHFLTTHPLSGIDVFVRSTIADSHLRLNELFGLLGLNQVYVPGAAVVIELFVVCLAIALVGKTRKATLAAWLLIAASVATTCIVAVGEYVTYSAVGSPIIDGIQGRYFIPLVAPFCAGIALLLRGRFAIADDAAQYKRATRLICVLMVVCLALSVAKYTYVTWGYL